MKIIDPAHPENDRRCRVELVEKTFLGLANRSFKIRQPHFREQQVQGRTVRVANQTVCQQTVRLSGKACPGRAPRATPLKNVAIAHAKHGNGGKRERAIDFIDSLDPAHPENDRRCRVLLYSFATGLWIQGRVIFIQKPCCGWLVISIFARSPYISISLR